VSGVVTRRLKAEIDAAWQAIASGYDIEPREYFDREAPHNGFRYPLVQALHHIWKRDPQVAPLVAERDRLRIALEESVKLQSHYAELLNMHDGGQRIGFASADHWLARLEETGTLPRTEQR
jgi:hypothetical protein